MVRPDAISVHKAAQHVICASQLSEVDDRQRSTAECEAIFGKICEARDRSDSGLQGGRIHSWNRRLQLSFSCKRHGDVVAAGDEILAPESLLAITSRMTVNGLHTQYAVVNHAVVLTTSSYVSLYRHHPVHLSTGRIRPPQKIMKPTETALPRHGYF